MVGNIMGGYYLSQNCGATCTSVIEARHFEICRIDRPSEGSPPQNTSSNPLRDGTAAALTQCSRETLRPMLLFRLTLASKVLYHEKESRSEGASRYGYCFAH